MRPRQPCPPHYRAGDLESADIIDAFFGRDAWKAQAVQYVLRASRKAGGAHEREDVVKAIECLDRVLDLIDARDGAPAATEAKPRPREAAGAAALAELQARAVRADKTDAGVLAAVTVGEALRRLPTWAGAPDDVYAAMNRARYSHGLDWVDRAATVQFAIGALPGGRDNAVDALRWAAREIYAASVDAGDAPKRCVPRIPAADEAPLRQAAKAPTQADILGAVNGDEDVLLREVSLGQALDFVSSDVRSAVTLDSLNAFRKAVNCAPAALGWSVFEALAPLSRSSMIGLALIRAALAWRSAGDASLAFDATLAEAIEHLPDAMRATALAEVNATRAREGLPPAQADDTVGFAVGALDDRDRITTEIRAAARAHVEAFRAQVFGGKVFGEGDAA